MRQIAFQTSPNKKKANSPTHIPEAYPGQTLRRGKFDKISALLKPQI
jgi:hypothetical protein